MRFHCVEVMWQLAPSNPLPRQPNPIRIPHPQQQFQITVLRRRQSAFPRPLQTHPRALPKNAHPMVPQQACQHCHKLDLGEFGARAVLRSVGPREECARLGGEKGFSAGRGGAENASGLESGDGIIHREGCHRSGSCQYLGCVWTARRLGMTPVWGGMRIVRSPTWSYWGCGLVHLGGLGSVSRGEGSRALQMSGSGERIWMLGEDAHTNTARHLFRPGNDVP